MTDTEAQRIARLITASISTTPGGRWRELTPLSIAEYLVAHGVTARAEVEA